MPKILAILLLFVFAAGCSVLQPPAPTPIIIVVTATPEAAATVTANASPSAPANVAPTVLSNTTPLPVTLTPAALTPGAASPTFPTKPTNVQFVRAKQDINIRKGPGTQYDIVGGVYAGQTARVTGFTSADEKWWRVICPDGTEGECWVSADTELTETATAPGAAEATTTTIPIATSSTEVNVETYVRQLAAALQGNNYDALRNLMADPFTFGYWQSQGAEFTRAEAIQRLQTQWVGPTNTVVVDLADKTDQTKLLNGTNPLSMWNPNVKIVKSVFVKGLGEKGEDEGLLLIAQREDQSLYWYGILYAAGGFVK